MVSLSRLSALRLRVIQALGQATIRIGGKPERATATSGFSLERVSIFPYFGVFVFTLLSL
jgi:hypothetical protein